MPAETKVVRVTNPFTGGLRDQPTSANQALELVDALYQLGVCSARGGCDFHGEANPLPTSPLQDVLEDIITAGGETTPDIVVAGSTGVIGLATDVSRFGAISLTTPFAGGTFGGYRFMRGLLHGQILAFPQDGESPILRFAGNIRGDDTYGAGGSWLKTDDKLSLPSLSRAIVSGDIGRYVTDRYNHGSRRIIAQLSASDVQIEVPWGVANSTSEGGWVTSFGHMGLYTKVTDRGKATLTALGLTVQGNVSTKWDTDGADYGRPGYFNGQFNAYVDKIAPIDANDYGEVAAIESVTDSDTLVLGQNASAFSASACDYVITRPLVGKWGFLHKDRLYTGGVRWAPRRMQISPPLWDGATSENGEFSYAVDIGRAHQTAYLEVPNPFTPGELVGGCSLPDGNGLVLSTTDAHIFWGEYPSISTQRIATFGAFSARSLVCVDGFVFFAGPTGVYEVRGNSAVSITDNHIQQTWTTLVQTARENSGFDPRVVLGFYDGHLVVSTSYDDETTIERVLVYDTGTRTWVGDWTIPAARGFWQTRVPGQKARLLAVGSGYLNTVPEPQVADIGPAFVAHTENITGRSFPGSFHARTPLEIAGNLSREREVKYGKVSYELAAASGNPGLTATFGPNASAPQDTYPSTTAGEPSDGISFPQTGSGFPSGNLGERTYEFDATYDLAAGETDTINRLVIREVEFLVKEYRLRG